MEVDERKVAYVKASYIYRMLDFTSWPTKDQKLERPVKIGFITEEDSPVFKAMQLAIAEIEKKRGEDIIELVRLPFIADSEAPAHQNDESLYIDITYFDILFLGKNYTNTWKKLQPLLSKKAILTIGDIDNFAVTGGMIQFTYKESRTPRTGTKELKLKLLLNIDNLSASKIKVSSKLLSLKSIVEVIQEQS